VAAYRISGARLIVRSQLPDQSRTGLIHPHHLDLLPFTAELEHQQPAMLPMKPVATLAMPWPMHSRFLSLRTLPSHSWRRREDGFKFLFLGGAMPGHAGADAIERR
jgi:hypothetical protein